MDFEIEVGGTPPSSARGGGVGKYESIADAAREAAPEWVHVAGINRNVAGSMRQGSIKGFAKFEFEVKIAGVDEQTGLGTLWVRLKGVGDDMR